MQLLRPIKIIRIIFGPVLPTLHASWKYFSRKRRKLYDLNFPLKNYHRTEASFIRTNYPGVIWRLFLTLKDIFAPDLVFYHIQMNGKNWIKGPFLVNKMDFLIVFWWFRPKQSQWVTLGYSRQRQQLWSRCQEEPFIRTHQEISENGMENAKQSGIGPCLCLIFPLVPVRPSPLLSF